MTFLSARVEEWIQTGDAYVQTDLVVRFPLQLKVEARVDLRKSEEGKT